VLGVPSDGAAEEGDTVGGTLAGEQFGIGETGMVVDREVQVLPAGVTVAGPGLVTEHALAECPEAAALLDVDVQQLTRAGALVATDRLASGQLQP